MDAHKLYQLLAAIPRGKVATYGQLAALLGDPHLARAVGNALHANPDGDRYPCYRVVNAAGKLSERYAFGGLAAQQNRLEQDGIPVKNGRVDLSQYQWTPQNESISPVHSNP